jgi:hypothetical protein
MHYKIRIQTLHLPNITKKNWKKNIKARGEFTFETQMKGIHFQFCDK